MKTVQKIFFAIIVVGMLSVIVFTNTKKDAVSDIDNRKLVAWKGDIEPYFKDRLGFRSQMINFYIVLNDRLFHEMIHPIYEYGQDGYVFFRFGKEAYDEEFIDLFCRYLRQVQDYCKQRGVKFLYCLNPAKVSVYSQFLPVWYSYEGRFHLLMIDALEKYGVHYIDNVAFLQEKSKTVQVFNPKYDAGHWNDWGAFYGTNHLLEEIAKDYPEVRRHEVGDFDIDTIVEKSLPVSLFIVNEKVPKMNLLNKNIAYIGDQYRGIHLHPRYGAFTGWQVESQQGPDVLFFHGSYYNSRIKFYQDRFHKVTGVHNYENFLDFDYYHNLFKADYVILETAEYATSAAYFDKEKLRTKVLNQPYDSVCGIVHERHAVKELKDYQTIEKEALLTISFAVPGSVAFGYLFVGKEEYDLQVNGDRAEVTLKKTDYDEKQASVVLFSV